MATLLSRTRDFTEGLAAQRRTVTGTALLRIGFGISGVAFYVTNYVDRTYFWGPDGVFPLMSSLLSFAGR